MMKNYYARVLLSFIFCCFATEMYAQSVAVGGRILDSEGAPIVGATIVVSGTQRGVSSAIDGTFKITGVEASDKLIVEYVGLKTETVLVGQRTNIDITLEPDNMLVEEVVVVGYGSMRKSDVSGAVESIGSADFADQMMQTSEEALKGRIAGVKVTGGNSPGSGVSIQIRGTNSMLGGTEPLYVVDGFPVEASTDAAGGSNTSPAQSSLNFINPNDIESIEVLKDASATAIYGARGANGVVLIQTKSGKSGRTTVTLNSSVGVTQLTREIDMLDAEGYANYMNQKEINRYYVQTEAKRMGYTKAEIDPIDLPYDGVNKPLPWELGEGTNWQDAVYRSAITTNQSLQINGGNEKTKMALNGGYTSNQGSIIETDFERFTLSAMVDHRISDRFKVSNRLNLARIESRGGNTSTGDVWANRGVVTNALWCQPTYGLVTEPDEDDLSEDNDGMSFNNPYLLATLLVDDKVMNSVQDIANLEYKIAKGLTSTGTFAYSRITNERNQYTPSSSKKGKGANGIANIASNDKMKYMVEGRLNYKTKIAKKHSIDLMAAASFEETFFNSMSQQFTDFPNDDLGYNNVSSANEVYSPIDDAWSSRLTSYIFRGNYNYRDKYLATVTFRADGTSRGADGNKFGFFPSAAFAWRVSQENFLKSVDWLSNLKVRASYGSTGNYPNQAYQSLAVVEFDKYPFNDVVNSGAYESCMENSDLTWERTDQYNVGLDMSFFRNKLSITVDAYYKLTKDLLQMVNVAPSSGFRTRLMNLGEIENKGIEFDINYNIISKKDMHLSFYANGGINRNKVLSLGDRDYITGSAIGGMVVNRFQVGQPLGVFYGLTHTGIFADWDQVRNSPEGIAQRDAAPGEFIFENSSVDYVTDANGNLVPSEIQDINEDDFGIIGDPNPDFVFGFGLNFSYKKLDFGVAFSGQIGGDIYWADYAVMTNMWRPYNMLQEAVDKSWIAPYQHTEIINGQPYTFGSATGNTSSAEFARAINWDDESTLPYIDANGKPMKISRYRTENLTDTSLHDATYLKVQNISIGYTFDRVWAFQKVRLSLSGTNLFTFSKYPGYDPDVTSSNSPMMRGIDLGAYPGQRNVSFSVQMQF